jgi:hypothetical protein
MQKVAQVRVLNYNGEDIGMGFNSDTGLAIGTALDFDPPTGTPPQEAEAEVTIVTSHEQLMESLHMDAQLEGRYAFASGSTKVTYSQNTQYNSVSTFVVAKLVINNGGVTRGRNFRLKPELQHLLDTNQFDTFAKAFGDSFVRGQYKGGEFYAVMRITSVDSKTETDLGVSLQLSVQGGVAGANFNGDLHTANLNEKTRSEFSVKYYQKAGAGAADIGTTLNVDEIKARLKNFPDAVKSNPFPYRTEVASYDTIPLPTPSKEQQDDFLLALTDADQKKLTYIQRRNDCDFAVENPTYFYDPPPKPTLQAASETYLQLLNAVIAHAVNLSNGKINPPQLFDPGKLTPPIALPDLELRKKDVGLESSFADWWVTKDKPATVRDSSTLAKAIGNFAMQQLNNFSAIVDPGGDPEKTLHLQGQALARVVAGLRGFTLAGFPGSSSAPPPVASVTDLPTMLPPGLTSLTLDSQAIVNLKGLEHFVRLTSLDLSHDQISDLSPLSALTALRDVRLVDNLVEDLSPLRACTQIESLDISGNDIQDLTPLNALRGLKSLTIAGTRMTDVVSGHVVQHRWSNPIADASPLASIPNLANPFVLGSSLAVRYGDLTKGPAAQYTGTALRQGNSNRFKVHLIRAAETLDDEWTLEQVALISGADASISDLFPGFQFPQQGVALRIQLASSGTRPSGCISYVSLIDRTKSVVDPVAFPVFATAFTAPTFDAKVVA